jgi:hypothetical protein
MTQTVFHSHRMFLGSDRKWSQAELKTCEKKLESEPPLFTFRYEPPLSW